MTLTEALEICGDYLGEQPSHAMAAYFGAGAELRELASSSLALALRWRLQEDTDAACSALETGRRLIRAASVLEREAYAIDAV